MMNALVARLSWLLGLAASTGRDLRSGPAPDDQINPRSVELLKQGEARARRRQVHRGRRRLRNRAGRRSAQPRRLHRARPASPSGRNCSARRSASPTRRWRSSRTISTRSPSRARRWSSLAPSPRARDNLAKLQKLCPSGCAAGDRACRGDRARADGRRGQAAGDARRPTKPARCAKATNSATLSVSARRCVSIPSSSSASSAPGMPLRLDRSILRRWPNAASVSLFEHRRIDARRASRAGTMCTTADATLGGGTNADRCTAIAIRGVASPLRGDRQPAVMLAVRRGDDPLGDFPLEHQRQRSPPRRPRPAQPAQQQARFRHCRAGWRRHARRRRPRRARRSSSRRLRSPAAVRRIPPRARPAPAGSAGRARPRRHSRRRRARRASARPGPARPRRPSGLRAGPGIAAIRASNCRSRMKFCPSALLAWSPCRAMTSRSGSTLRRSRHFQAVTPRIRRPCGSPRPLRRGSARSCAGDVERGAMVGRGADDRQAQRDVDAFLEMERLQRDQRLVMVHAERRVVARARALAWNMVSAGWGPVTRQPSARSAAMAGSMISISSRPSVPPSPACGLSAGDRQPRLGDPEIALQPAQRRAAARFDQRRSTVVPATSASGMCVVTGTVRSVGPASIIATLAGDTPQRSATNSVWPGCAKPMRVELLLGYRTGDHRRGRSRSREPDRDFERIERAMRAGHARAARNVAIGRRDAGAAAGRHRTPHPPRADRR